MTGHFCTLHFLTMYCNFLFLTILSATRVKLNSGLYGYIVQMGTFYDCQVSEIPGFYFLSDLSEQLLILKSTVFVCYLGRGIKPMIWVNMVWDWKALTQHLLVQCCFYLKIFM